MKIDPKSLFRTIDAVEDAYFFDKMPSQADRETVAKWIASRQGLPGSYAEMFAPTPEDIKTGIRLFTGEVVRSGAALRHISGEEASRALLLLNSKSKDVQGALTRATTGIGERLERCDKTNNMYCCGSCDPSLWRHITAGGLRGSEAWLAKGMKALKAHRDGHGDWRRFPFFYTLFALMEIDFPTAKQEIKYAAPICEKYLARAKRTDALTLRRKAVVERVLARV